MKHRHHDPMKFDWVVSAIISGMVVAVLVIMVAVLMFGAALP